MTKLPLTTRIFFLIVAAGGLLGLYAACIEPFTLKVVRWTVPTEKWGAQAELNILLMSDTHVIWPSMTPAHLQQIVREANALKPDLILLLGDYVGTHPFGLQVDPAEGVAPLKNLSAPCGVYAVIGNHDMHPPLGWPEALAAAGIPVLENQARAVTCGGRSFWVAGLEDIWWQHADSAKAMGAITGRNPVIMMTHNPDSFPDMPSSIALGVAGHTHNGQIRFPFIGAVEAVIPSKYGKRYLYGHINEDGKDYVVTGGLGMSGLPLRFLAPPELALVTLKGAAAQ